MARHSHRFTTEEAKADTGMSLKNKAMFHYFNPNGAHAKAKNAGDRVSTFVRANKLPEGALLVHTTTFNNFHSDNLSRQVMRKAPNKFKLNYSIEGLLKQAEEALQFIEERK